MRANDEREAIRRRGIAWDDGIEAGKRGERADENPYRFHRDPVMAKRWELARQMASRLTSVVTHEKTIE